MKFYLFIVIAYLLGSLSPSIIQGRLAGVDIKKEGSGNAGTTNTLRVLGKKAALLTLAVDIAKGVIAVLIGMTAGRTCGYICALAVFAGHVWPAYYGFKGGKGVATAFGLSLAINWKMALILALVLVVFTAVTKRMSVGSLAAACAMPIVSFLLERSFVFYGLLLAVIVIIKHSSNIKRLIEGEEPPLSFKK